MPTKRNYQGNQQNYDPHDGEYEAGPSSAFSSFGNPNEKKGGHDVAALGSSNKPFKLDHTTSKDGNTTVHNIGIEFNQNGETKKGYGSSRDFNLSKPNISTYDVALADAFENLGVDKQLLEDAYNNSNNLNEFIDYLNDNYKPTENKAEVNGTELDSNDKLTGVRGADDQYLAQVKKDYENASKLLATKGIDTAQFKNFDDIAEYEQKFLDDWEKSGDYNNAEKDEIYKALDKVFDKYAADDYAKKAPYGKFGDGRYDDETTWKTHKTDKKDNDAISLGSSDKPTKNYGGVTEVKGEQVDAGGTLVNKLAGMAHLEDDETKKQVYADYFDNVDYSKQGALENKLNQDKQDIQSKLKTASEEEKATYNKQLDAIANIEKWSGKGNNEMLKDLGLVSDENDITDKKVTGPQYIGGIKVVNKAPQGWEEGEGSLSGYKLYQSKPHWGGARDKVYVKNDINQEQEPTNFKKQQLDKILKANPATDDYHTWIREEDDIKTFQEALEYDGMSEEDDVAPDYTSNDIKKALKTGKVKVYSSKPIKTGNFVTPSKTEAQSYAGKGKLYEAEVNLEDVAWIDSIQGQYAK